MSDRGELEFDEIGYWSEVKLEIVRDYAARYSQILAAQTTPHLHHVYIDGFAGAGVHISRATGELVPGSPLNALGIQPPFREHFLVDLDGGRAEHLRQLVGDREDVHVLHGDCNHVLLEEVFPLVRWEDFRRGLCLLDPYGLHLDWAVIEAAGKAKSIEIFLNFPVMDMNRNALWRQPERVTATSQHRMTAFWGDESWRDAAYHPSSQLGFFGEEQEKASNDQVAESFRQRLVQHAGFRFVPPPLPMCNSIGAVVYFLFFASHNDTGRKIVSAIFDRYRERGG